MRATACVRTIDVMNLKGLRAVLRQLAYLVANFANAAPPPEAVTAPINPPKMNVNNT